MSEYDESQDEGTTKPERGGHCIYVTSLIASVFWILEIVFLVFLMNYLCGGSYVVGSATFLHLSSARDYFIMYMILAIVYGLISINMAMVLCVGYSRSVAYKTGCWKSYKVPAGFDRRVLVEATIFFVYSTVIHVFFCVASWKHHDNFSPNSIQGAAALRRFSFLQIAAAAVYMTRIFSGAVTINALMAPTFSQTKQGSVYTSSPVYISNT